MTIWLNHKNARPYPEYLLLCGMCIAVLKLLAAGREIWSTYLSFQASTQTSDPWIQGAFPSICFSFVGTDRPFRVKWSNALATESEAESESFQIPTRLIPFNQGMHVTCFETDFLHLGDLVVKFYLLCFKI